MFGCAFANGRVSIPCVLYTYVICLIIFHLCETRKHSSNIGRGRECREISKDSGCQNLILVDGFHPLEKYVSSWIISSK